MTVDRVPIPSTLDGGSNSATSHLIIIDATPQGVGWFPINHMVRLASRLFAADVTVVEAARRPPLLLRSASLFRRRVATGSETETCLLICASPADLLHLIEIPGWRKRFRFVAAWVIDSFWIDWIPRTVRLSMPFDHVFISSGEDIDGWYRSCGLRPTWLPWGTDALQLGSGTRQRPWDLTRVGRQPEPWDDDDVTSADAIPCGVRFRPRPAAVGKSPLDHHLSLMQAYRETKFMLAFSNLVNPTPYTHPSRDYLTGRWVDALGAGATVAGTRPRGSCIDQLLWPAATLELGTTERKEGLRVIAEAVSAWDPDVARQNHRMALARLDWRHRFRVIAETFGEMPAALADDLLRLDALCDTPSASDGKPR